MQVVNYAGPFQLQNRLFLCPDPSESDIWERVGEDAFCFFRAHCMSDEVGFCRTNAFNVQATRPIADKAPNSFLAMTDAEVNVGMFFQIRFAVFVIGKGRHFINVEAFAKPSKELDITDGTLLSALQLLVAQSLFPSPFRQRIDEPLCLFFAQVGNMVVKTKDVLQPFNYLPFHL